jgi:uncharacterized protein (DUF433 family)
VADGNCVSRLTNPGCSGNVGIIADWQETAMRHDRTEMNPQIMTCKPVIRGTRIPVELILRKLGAGMLPEAILADHPRLMLEDIHAAQAFAAA